MKTTICLIRHGETAWNTERRIQGHTDIELNEEGIKQANAAAAWLSQNHPNITQIYSSDLQRAWLTASCIADACNLKPTADATLRERCYGSFEGLTYQQAKERYPEEYRLFETRVPEFALPDGGESLKTLFARITATLQSIAATHTGETIAVVCHGGVLDIVNRFVRQKALQDARDFEVPNAGFNWVSYHPYEQPRWAILEWGSTQHLHHAALDELPG